MNRLISFLTKHEANDNNKLAVTHTRIPNAQLQGCRYGGKFHISTKEDLQRFHRLYINDMFVDPKGSNEMILQHPVPLYAAHFTEKQLDENAAIMIDLDLKYDSNQVDGRCHDERFCVNVAHAYVKTLFCKMADLDQLRSTYGQDHLRFPVFVMQKDDTAIDPKHPNVRKDGVHIVIGLAIDRSHHIRLREWMVPELAKIIETHNLPIINQPEDVLDASVAKGGSNWQLYGSCKPQCQPYKLSFYYECALKLDQSEGALRIKYERMYSRIPIANCDDDESGRSDDESDSNSLVKVNVDFEVECDDDVNIEVNIEQKNSDGESDSERQ